MKTITKLQTKGGRYAIDLTHDDSGFTIRTYEHGDVRSSDYLGKISDVKALEEFNKNVRDAKYFGSINYSVKVI